MTTKEQEKLIEEEIQNLIYPYKQPPAITTSGEELLPINEYWNVSRIKASLERLYEKGREDGKQEMSDMYKDDIII
mgnify:CR=1 FL=1